MRKILFFFSVLVSTFSGILFSQTCTPFTATDTLGNDEVLIDCSYPLKNSQCLSLQASAPSVREATSYKAEAIAYSPYIPFNEGTPLNANYDDLYAEVIDIPFRFCFFGNNYNKLVIGSNGLVSFDTSLLGKLSYPNIEKTNPDPLLPHNAIFGVFQDLVFSSADDSEIYYSVIQSGACRKLVINFYRGRVVGCQERSSTQIVLTEFTNEIEIFIENKELPCPTARFSNALLGIINSNGTVGYSPAGRNTGIWSALEEAWRFSPDGNVITPVISWFNAAGTALGSGSSIDVCPSQNTSYTVKATYQMCGSPFVLTDSIDVKFAPDFPLVRNYTKVFCTPPGGSESINLDDFQQFLTPQDPALFTFTYHNTLADANANTNSVSTSVNVNSEQVIYVRVQNKADANCYRVAMLRFQFINSVILSNTASICDTNNDGTEAAYNLSGLNPQLFAPEISGSISYFLSQTDAQNNTNAVTSATLTNGTQLWILLTTAQCSQVIGPVTVNFTPGPAVNSPLDLNLTICDVNDNNTEPYDFAANVSSLVTTATGVIISYYETYQQAYQGVGSQVTTVKEGVYSVYVRVEEPGGCFSVAEIRLNVDFNEVVATNEVAQLCFDGSEDVSVNLATLSSSMLQSPLTGVTTTFHANAADAEEGLDPISHMQVITDNGNSVTARYFVRFEESPACYTVRTITVVLTHPVAVKSNFTVCDFNNDNTETFNLNQYTSQIAGAQPATIRYFASVQEAQDNSNALTSFTLTGPTQLFVRIEVNSCSEVYPINLQLVPTPVVTPEIAVNRKSYCDNNNDGGEAYDLTQHQAQLYTGGPAVDFTYYTGYNSSSQTFSGLIPDPKRFAAIGENTVYVRVRNTSTGCFSVSVIKLKIDFVAAPRIKEATLRICDEQFNFNESFNLNSALPQMYDAAENGVPLSGMTVTYYRTAADANAGIPTTAISSAQVTMQSLVTVYARFESKTSGCYSVKPIHLRTYFPPKAINSTINNICDSNLDGLYELNLLQYTSQVTDLSDPDNIFTFYRTLPDAQNGVNAIADPENFRVNPLPAQIFVKIANIPGCDDISAINLNPGTKLPLINSGPFALAQCDILNDGQETIDLTQYQNEIYPGAQFEYYPSLSDMNNAVDQIVNPQTFSFNKNSQNSAIYVKVSFAGFCPVYAVINVNLKKTPQFTLPTYYFCPYNNDSVDITPDFTGQDIVSFSWKDPVGTTVSTSNQLRGVNKTGTYTLDVVASNGCTFSTSFEVRHFEVPVITQLVANGNNYTVIATGSKTILYSIDGMSWQTGNIFYNLPVGQTTFYVKFSGEECIGLPKKGVILNIPNAFTPNEDGINDVWEVSGLDVFDGANSTIQIFDRQQVLVHQEEGPDRLSWNGRWMGRPVPTDTYWYVLRLPDGRIFYGWIFLKNRN